ncbi:MAG TPA: hypothetical protein VGG18_06970 [Granulicella sp.]|jgi:hypothetical protein
MVPAPQQLEIDSDASWELLLRVVNSNELKRSLRLRELLLYLGKRSLKSNVASIREQEIGAAVFGRPEDYDTGIDNIVRVNVSELRKRLAHYFQEEGAAEPILIEIPRGGYFPVFLSRSVAIDNKTQEHDPTPEPITNVSVSDPKVTVEPDKASASQQADVVRHMPGRRLPWILGIALLLAISASAFLFWQNHALRLQLQPWHADSNRAAFWSQFFSSGQQVDIVTADTSYAIAEDLLQRPISLDDYLDYKYKSDVDLPGITPQTREALRLVLDRNTGSVGDFEAAERIMGLDAYSPALKLASARSYTPQSIKDNNVILIGGRASNPWVELYKDRTNFSIEYDPLLHRSYVLNRSPAEGEQHIYEIVQDPDKAYSIIAFVPNFSNHRYALIIAGTDSQGTRAAGEFITSSEGLAAIRQRLPADRYPYFEVLLSSSRLEGTTLHTVIQTSRGYAH